ncbi:type I secretion system permease/ATPase [Alkalilimnicola ehrlichii MLHE-1]|uniref:ABC transporter related protein n=1 Tax=Alkalilimnicola ehrlichii (strain ATCC BAA-1101 / DSM 17681 / MLHE-1) TaxID=187272 RepID=Q0A6M8_ALKEH|nr:type I secretion system permease/ATPase [Alkalilimnicola ehrlichii]ABI57509.1 ABC transporter related protein [Alkalilimnicola ehrlichii MLHE-1]
MTTVAADSEQARPGIDPDAWLEAFLYVARAYDCNFSEQNVRVASAWEADRADPDRLLARMAGQLGLKLHAHDEAPDWERLSPWRLPLVLAFADGRVGVLEGRSRDGRGWQVAFSGEGGLPTPVSVAQLREGVVRVLVPRPARNAADPRIDEYIQPYRPHWFRSIIFDRIRPYGHVMLASLLANTLALAGLIFAMQVYDRVIPVGSLPTLYVLFSGVLLALLFELSMRVARVSLIDLLGKRADLRISDRVFGHALRIKNTQRPGSTGTFISQLRELDRVRDFMTSTTVSVLADLPFFLLFLAVFWYVAGSLVLIPLVALLVLVVPGLLAQGRLHRLAREAIRESSLRNAMLVESVQGLDDIKTLQAEPRFQNQWNHFNGVTTDVNLRLRFLTNSLTAWAQTVQTGSFAVVVLFGAPMVMAGDLTTGTLVAASILASRMLAPMGQLNQVLSRWQHARVALQGLDQIMQRPVDHPEEARRVHRVALEGAYRLEKAAFRYSADDAGTALEVARLRIEPGERVGLVGRNGAGKSTLIQALSGLLEPAEGELRLDGVRLGQLDPADVRRDVGVLTQQARLFYGTVRDNLLLGAPRASDEALLAALRAVGGEEVFQNLPNGLDHTVKEGGQGLSGGQRQLLLVARLLLREPRILLLDEPTTALDDSAERRVIDHLDEFARGRTLVVATHRRNVLRLVDRVIVVDGGRVVLDDTRDRALRRLAGQTNDNGRERRRHA